MSKLKFIIAILLMSYHIASAQFQVNSNTIFYISKNNLVSTKEDTIFCDTIYPKIDGGLMLLNGLKRQKVNIGHASRIEFDNDNNFDIVRNLWVQDQITLTKGILYTENNIITLEHMGTVAGIPNDYTHVDGWFRKNGNTAFTYPVGDDNLYAPISISAPSLTSDHFTARYYHESPNTPSYFRGKKVATIDHVSNCEYWILDRTSGSSTVNVTLSYNYARSCIVNDLATLKVARWDGTIWQDHQGTVNGSDTMQGSITSVPVSSFSPFTLASGNKLNPLPVTLLSFTHECFDNGTKVKWTSTFEINNKQYDLFRSYDGQEWTYVATINGAGNSTTRQDYSYLDYAHFDAYYRLEQSDIELKSTPLKVQKAECNAKEMAITVEAFPNPATDFITIKRNIDEPATVGVFDKLGRRIETHSINNYEQKLGISHLASGVYILKIDSESNQTIVRIQKD